MARMKPQQMRRKSDIRKAILFWATVGIVVSGLFPPWLYTFNRSAAGDDFGWHSERSAGYAFIFKPPEPHLGADASGQIMSLPPDPKLGEYLFAYCGIKLDLVRLLVEWVCILAVCGAIWLRESLSDEKIQRTEDSSVPLSG
jgi:hypothetical protein